MKNTLTRLRPVMALLAILLISGAAFYAISVPRHTVTGTAVNGTLDLTDADFDANSYTLDGAWEFYDGWLYTPADFTDGEAPGAALIDIPYAWREEIHQANGYATYRLTLLTKDDTPLMLHIPEIAESSVVYVNGGIVHRAGQLGVTDKYIPAYRNAFVSFTPANGRAEILVQASNLYESGGGSLFYSFKIGGEEPLLRDAMLRRVLLSAVLGLMVMMALYHLMLFFANRKEKIYLWYVLYVAVIVLRMAMESNGLVQLFAPGGLSEALSRMYLTCFSGQAIFLILFTLEAFGLPYWPRKAGLRAAYGVGALILLGNILTELFVPALPESLIYLSILPFALVTGAAACRFAKNRRAYAGSYMGLYLISLCLFLFWGIGAKMLADNLWFTPGVFSNLFMALSQVVILSLRYGKAREAESLLTAENAMLDRQSRLRAELMETISHETRTPLAVLSSYAGLVAMELRDKGVEEQIAADLDKVVYEAKRVASLIDGMKKLAFHKENPANRTALDMGGVIRQTAELYRHILERSGSRLILQIPDELPLAYGNAEELTQVLFNILQNAKNHAEQGSVTVTASAENGFIRVCTADTGEGIAPELLPRVFERGVSGRGGSGLGLAICREIIEAHGGEITIESEQGKGAAVTFAVPVEGSENER